MNVQLLINGNKHELDCIPSETLLSAVRRLGFYGVKFGDKQGLSGSDTVLLDGKPVNAGSLLEGGLLNPGQSLYFAGNGIRAKILSNGHLKCGDVTGSIHGVAKALMNYENHCDGKNLPRNQQQNRGTQCKFRTADL